MSNNVLKRMLEGDLDSERYRIEMVDDVIKLVNKDLYEFPMFINVGDEHILVQTSLLPFTEVPSEKISEIDDAILRLNPIMPLSAIAKDKTGYIIYGELSASSRRDEMLQEIMTLEDNLIGALEFFKEYV